MRVMFCLGFRFNRHFLRWFHFVEWIFSSWIKIKMFSIAQNGIDSFLFVRSFVLRSYLIDGWMNECVCEYMSFSNVVFFSVFLSLFSDSTLQSIYLNHFLSSSILYLHHSISLPVYEKVKIKLTDPVIPLPSPRLPRKRHYWKTQHLLKS